GLSSRKAAHNHPRERWSYTRVDECRCSGYAMDLLHQQITDSITLERQGSCTQFIENHTKRIKVTATSGSIALSHLWGDIGGIAERQRAVAEGLIYAKIDELWF